MLSRSSCTVVTIGHIPRDGSSSSVGDGQVARPSATDACIAPVGPTTKEYLAWADAHPILRIVIPCEQLLKLNRKSMQETVEESAKRGRRASVWMIALGVIRRARRGVKPREEGRRRR